MSASNTVDNDASTGVVAEQSPEDAEPSNRAPLTKKEISADHPTWCPGCGDFSILALYFRLIQQRGLHHEKITTVAGIGCSSRFPYFVQANGVHFIHGRALPFATGVALSRPDLHTFVFGGDGDAFSIGGNHLTHTARKNVNLTYVIMDNFVYGLTKKQTSPTSPIGFRSKTDVGGSKDKPINPMKQLVAAGATFIARTTATNPKHLLAMMDKAMDHDGFSVIECLSECVEFYPGAFDKATPRKGGEFKEIPEDHDVTSELEAYKLADDSFPGYFGIFYDVNEPTKNANEASLISSAREKVAGMQDWEILQKTFDRVK